MPAFSEPSQLAPRSAQVCGDPLRRTARSTPDNRLTVRALLLNGNTLPEGELVALAELLVDPATNPIGEIELNNTMPASEIEIISEKYMAGLECVLTAAFTSKAPNDTVGVTLSLSYHACFRSTHIAALHRALKSASRHLQRLSLTNVTVFGRNATTRLGELFFSPLHVVTADSEIDLSGILFHDKQGGDAQGEFFLGHFECVKAAMVSWRYDGLLLQCRVFQVDVFRDKQLTTRLPLLLDTRAFYTIHKISTYGRIQLVLPESELENGQAFGWISRRIIAAMRTIDGKPLVDWNFSGLIGTPVPFIQRVIEMAGVQLQRIALRGRWLGQILGRLSCSNLQQLNLAGSTITDVAHNDVWISRVASTLRALDISHCQVDEPFVQSLERLSRLQYVSLTGVYRSPSKSDWWKCESPSIQYIEADRSLGQRDDLQRLPCKLHRRDCILDSTKAAFLSVLDTLESRHKTWQHISMEAIVSILQYAGDPLSCILNWSGELIRKNLSA